MMATREPESDNQAAPRSGERARPGRILIVDDDGAITEALGDLLNALGYEVATAATGVQALHTLRTQPRPDLILLDLMMPMGNGWVFRIEQQKDPEIASIPVVVFSGVHDPGPAAEYLNADGFLGKPVDPDRLFELLRRFCGDPPAAKD